MSVVKKCFRTVCPKLPVPPVINRVFPLKIVSAMLASLYIKIGVSLPDGIIRLYNLHNSIIKVTT